MCYIYKVLLFYYYSFYISICTYMIFEGVFFVDALNNLDQYDDDDE